MEVDKADDLTIETQEEEIKPSVEESTDDTSSEDLIVTIGEETPPQEEKEQAPAWVKELRKKHRELAKENQALKAQLNKPTEEQEVKLGQKPTLEDCDYDPVEFEQKLEQWHEKKREVDRRVTEAQRKEQEAKDDWNKKLDLYETKKSELKVKDYEDAEDVVRDTLSEVQQGIIVGGADNPALVVYALGKNPKKAEELAAIKDPVKFSFALGKLEAQLKTTTRSAPPPEKMVSPSSAPLKSDSTLERLREKAEKTGDFSEYLAYKRKTKEGLINGKRTS